MQATDHGKTSVPVARAHVASWALALAGYITPAACLRLVRRLLTLLPT